MENFAPELDAPVYIVTCSHDGEPAGCLVGFATQCSVLPPRFLVCLSIANHTFEIAKDATSLAVHILSEREESLAALFGEKTDDDSDKFAEVAWSPGVTGAPILSDCRAKFEGKVLSTIPFGDHVGFLLAPVEEIDVADVLDARQLLLRDVADYEPGHPLGEESESASDELDPAAVAGSSA